MFTGVERLKERGRLLEKHGKLNNIIKKTSKICNIKNQIYQTAN